jgi:RNA recognition motif-containing protein
MNSYGSIKEINIPSHPDKKTSRGFAFVEMSNKNECLKAIKMLNGTSFKGRTIVLDMAVSKENFMTEKLN